MGKNTWDGAASVIYVLSLTKSWREGFVKDSSTFLICLRAGKSQKGVLWGSGELLGEKTSGAVCLGSKRATLFPNQVSWRIPALCCASSHHRQESSLSAFMVDAIFHLLTRIPVKITKLPFVISQTKCFFSIKYSMRFLLIHSVKKRRKQLFLLIFHPHRSVHFSWFRNFVSFYYTVHQGLVFQSPLKSYNTKNAYQILASHIKLTNLGKKGIWKSTNRLFSLKHSKINLIFLKTLKAQCCQTLRDSSWSFSIKCFFIRKSGKWLKQVCILQANTAELPKLLWEKIFHL